MPFARLLKLKFPFASAVVVALAAPLRVTVAPLPLAAGLRVPVIDQDCTAAVKLSALTLAPVTVTTCDAGEKLTPALLGVTV